METGSDGNSLSSSYYYIHSSSCFKTVLLPTIPFRLEPWSLASGDLVSLLDRSATAPGNKSHEWLETRSSASSDIMTDVLQDGCFGVDCCFRFSLLTGHVSVT